MLKRAMFYLHFTVTIGLAVLIVDLKTNQNEMLEVDKDLIHVVNTNADVSRKVKSAVDTHTLAIEYLFEQHKNWGKASTNECPREDIIL